MIIDRLRRPDRVVQLLTRPRSRYLVTVIVTGLVGGATGAAFLALLEVVDHVLGPEAWGDAAHIAVLAGVGGAVALLTAWLGRPPGMELLVDNIHVSSGPEPLRGLRSLLPSSLLCIGAGGTLGPEAPLVTTTGSFGSWLGVRLGLGPRERRIVAIAGMAAGFTVLFGAPLGSTIFALEILHKRGLEYYEALLPAAIGALCGLVVLVAVTDLGLTPMFPFPVLGEPTGAWLIWGCVAGVVGAAIAAGFTYSCALLSRILAPLPAATRPIVGGIALGLLAVASPYALTNGELQIVELNTTTLAAGTLLLAAAAKFVAAAVSVTTGWKGGFIIPLFFVGYALARAVGPDLPGADEWVLAAALMAAANVGVTKTPIGSTLVVTEMAGTVALPSPLIASLVSLLLTSGVGLITSQRRRFDPTEQ